MSQDLPVQFVKRVVLLASITYPLGNDCTRIDSHLPVPTDEQVGKAVSAALASLY
jgi:hypothetical protein